MSKDNRKTCKLAIAGLIVAVVAPCLLVLFIFAVNGLNKYLDIILDLLVLLMLTIPFIALPLSIAGVVVSKKTNKKGIMPGIVGLILSIAEILFVIITIWAYLADEKAPGHSLDIVPPHIGTLSGIETSESVEAFIEGNCN